VCYNIGQLTTKTCAGDAVNIPARGERLGRSHGYCNQSPVTSQFIGDFFMSIYFIRSGQYIKIGTSANPWIRLYEFQTGNPEPLEMLGIAPGDRSFEIELQRLFEKYHHNNEWFFDNDHLRQFIKVMRDLFPNLQQPPDEQDIGERLGGCGMYGRYERLPQAHIDRLSEAEKDRMIRLYRAGQSLRSLELEFFGFVGGTAYHTVKAIVSAGDVNDAAAESPIS
jgi:hypothetical protein